MQLERMGLNEYGKRLEIMRSHHSVESKKKQRLFPNNGLTVHSSLLGPFKLPKNDLALPFLPRLHTSRSDHATESKRLFGNRSSLPFYSSVARTGQYSRGDPAMATSRVTVIEQIDRSHETDLNVQQPPITGIAQRFHASESNVSAARESERTEEILQLQWMEAKDRLKESMREISSRDVKVKDSMRELEEFKRRVGEIDPQSYSPHFLATASANVSKEIGHLQDLSQLAHDPALSSAAAVDRPRAEELGPKSLELRPPVWKLQYDGSSLRHDNTIKDLKAEIEMTSSHLTALQLTRKEAFLKPDEIYRDKFEDKERTVSVAFAHLSDEEEKEVDRALTGRDGFEVLAMHAKSSIDITRTVMQCLKPGVWLNDDVINLYLELLKERELREPEKFLKCHFFNTFFFNKLYKDTHSYNFKAVRRWTTQKKLGYNLLECDKIFVPIHKDIHWCLAIINVQEKKLLYLDSLKGRDRDTLQILAKYIKDEAHDKLNRILDVSSWDWDCPNDIPEQLNGCDCGMFMIKYADFHSHGDSLNFTQEHMEYFRRRTVLELLQLKAR